MAEDERGVEGVPAPPCCRDGLAEVNGVKSNRIRPQSIGRPQ